MMEEELYVNADGPPSSPPLTLLPASLIAEPPFVSKVRTAKRTENSRSPHHLSPLRRQPEASIIRPCPCPSLSSWAMTGGSWARGPCLAALHGVWTSTIRRCVGSTHTCMQTHRDSASVWSIYLGVEQELYQVLVPIACQSIQAFRVSHPVQGIWRAR